jgi:hypothetical protein
MAHPGKNLKGYPLSLSPLADTSGLPVRSPPASDRPSPPVITLLLLWTPLPTWQSSPPSISFPRANPSPSCKLKPAINSPASPPSPRFSSHPNRPQNRRRSLTELRPTSRCRRPIPPPTVSPSHSPSSYPLRLALAHPPDLLAWSKSSQIRADNHTRSIPPRRRSPAASLSFIWTQSRTSIKRTRSPCRPEARRRHAVIQESPEARRRSPVCAPRRHPLVGNLT